MAPRKDTPGVEDLTPPDAVERMTAALGGREWRGVHHDPPKFPRAPLADTMSERTASVVAALRGEAS